MLNKKIKTPLNCKTCNSKDFVHADLYCNGCPDKPKPVIKTGRAYLFRRGFSEPICSVDVKVPSGLEIEFAAVELMSSFQIEFIESGSN